LLDEYSLRFFWLLEEAVKLDANDRLNEITIVSVPYLKKEQTRRVIHSLERQARGVIDLDDQPDKDYKEKLTKIFNRT